MVQQRPVVSSANLGSGENDLNMSVRLSPSEKCCTIHTCVEGHIVLAHELIEGDLIGILPPLLPLIGIVGRDGGIADTGVEPHVDDLLLIPRQRHRHTPLEISRDAAGLQALCQPRLRDGHAVLRPSVLLVRVLEPLLNLGLQLLEADKDVRRVSGHGGGAVDLATRVDELKGIQQAAALVALVAPGVVVVALGTRPLDEAVRQEGVVLLAVGLLRRPLLEVVALVQLEEDVLHNLRLLLRRRAAKVVEPDLEPVVNLLVLDVELVAQLLRRLARLQRLGLRRRAVLVRAADVERRPVAQLAEARVDVGAQHAAHDVAQVRHVVHVRQGAGDEHVLLALDGQDGIFNRHGFAIFRATFELDAFFVRLRCC